MAPTPKPPGQRRRRNAGQAQWKKLPAEKPRRKTPPLPGEIHFSPHTRRWWKTVWQSPMSAIWLDADVLLAERAALLYESIYGTDEGASMAAWAELRQIEDRLGLSPRARRALQWEVEQAGAAGSEATPEDDAKDDERFLKLVEG